MFYVLTGIATLLVGIVIATLVYVFAPEHPFEGGDDE
jgi:hypothetical protein